MISNVMNTVTSPVNTVINFAGETAGMLENSILTPIAGFAKNTPVLNKILAWAGEFFNPVKNTFSHARAAVMDHPFLGLGLFMGVRLFGNDLKTRVQGSHEMIRGSVTFLVDAAKVVAVASMILGVSSNLL